MDAGMALGAVASDLSGWSFTITAVAGAVLTALAVGIPLRAEHDARVRARTAEQIAEEEAARIQLVLNDALEPLTHLKRFVEGGGRTPVVLAFRARFGRTD